jgi:hypothetical protein
MNAGCLAGAGFSVSVVSSGERVLVGADDAIPAVSSGEPVLAGVGSQNPAVNSGQQPLAGVGKHTQRKRQKNSSSGAFFASLLLFLCLLKFPLASASEQFDS